MTSMRRLGTLYQTFLSKQYELGSITNREGTAADMFLRSNFPHLEGAIQACTTRGDAFGNGLDDLKHGLKTGLYYLIQRTCKFLKGLYLVNDEDDKAESVSKFLEVFQLRHDFLFADAAYAAHKSRNERLRKPSGRRCQDNERIHVVTNQSNNGRHLLHI